MTTLVHKKRLNVMESARPGMQASVGDTLITPQLAVSTPGMPVRNDKIFYDRPSNGSLMTPQPYVMDSNWNMGRSENVAYGLIQQDLRAPDRLHEPINIGVPQYSWRNKIATVYEAKRSGFKFLPLPGPYKLAAGEMVRGGQVARTTDVEGLYKVVQSQQESPSVGLARNNDAMFRKQFRINSGKSNYTQNSPMVSNTPKSSLNSNSGSFRIMDPHSLVSSPVINPFVYGE